MTIDAVGAVVLIALLALPFAVQFYLYRLPEAPACPACRATTRPLRERIMLQWVPALATTSLGECTVCGWRGRMRWRWAHRLAPRKPG